MKTLKIYSILATIIIGILAISIISIVNNLEETEILLEQYSERDWKVK